jgi:hypothetical protein
VQLDVVHCFPGGGQGAAKVEQELLQLAQLLPLAPARGPLGGGGVSAISSVRTRCCISALAVLIVSTALARSRFLHLTRASDGRVTPESGGRALPSAR